MYSLYIHFSCLIIFYLFSCPKLRIHSQELTICCQECNYLDLDCLYRCDKCESPDKKPSNFERNEGLLFQLIDLSHSWIDWVQTKFNSLVGITPRESNHIPTAFPRQEGFLASSNNYSNYAGPPSAPSAPRNSYELSFEEFYRHLSRNNLTDVSDFEWQRHLFLEKQKLREKIPNLKPCCGDCLQSDIQCLSSCQKFDCEDLDMCVAAGHGAYANYCQKRCLGLRSLSEIRYIPNFICSNVCTTVVMERCAIDACRSYGCEINECISEADQICHIT